jgi:thiamine-phosphate pyrophosphorylase
MRPDSLGSCLIPASNGRDVTDAEPSCGLYAVVEADAAAPERLSAALAAVDLASVLIVASGETRLEVGGARPLVELAQRAGVAALVAGDAALARALEADGVHLGPGAESVAAYQAARGILGAGGIVGVDAGISRHDAMSLAEAGADYVAFGAPAHLNDREKGRARRDELVAWWAEIFEVPCVTFDVEAPEEAARLARAGADFIAVRLAAESSSAVESERLAAIAEALRMPEAA